MGRPTPRRRSRRGAQAEQKRWVAEGVAAKKKLVKHANISTKNSNGSKTWTIQMGTTTEHTDMLAFAPTPRTVEGRRHRPVRDNSAAPHTATFVGKQQPITNPVGPQTDDPSPGTVAADAEPRPTCSTPAGSRRTCRRHPAGQPPPKSRPELRVQVQRRGSTPTTASSTRSAAWAVSSSRLRSYAVAWRGSYRSSSAPPGHASIVVTPKPWSRDRLGELHALGVRLGDRPLDVVAHRA